MSTTPEEIIVKNWEQFQAQAKKHANKEALSKLLADVQDSAMTAPASTRRDYTCAYPGGLVEHSLRVLALMVKLRETYNLRNEIPSGSLILTGLFHDIGKVGTGKANYYLDQTSQWHRDKLGQMYEVNPALSHMSVSQLSLLRLSEFGVQVSPDEWYAVSSLRDVKNRDESTPVNSEPMLAVILQQAVRVSAILGKGRTQVGLFSLDNLTKIG